MWTNLKVPQLYSGHNNQRKYKNCILTQVVLHTGKVIASIFWDAEGVLLVHYLDKGHTITGAYSADLLRQLWEKIKQIQHEQLFHQDNALAHMSKVAMAAI